MPTVHLVNPLWSDVGGSEWRALSLHKLINSMGEAHLWSEHQVHPEIAAKYPVKRLDAGLGHYPKDGVLVFVGAYFGIGAWVKNVRPVRTVLVFNTFSQSLLPALLQFFRQMGLPSVEIVYASGWLMDRTGLPGTVQPSIVDLERFKPKYRSAQRPYTIGRLSRDVPEKHHPQDIPLYLALAASGCRIRIMGGTCLAETLGNVSGIELLPSGNEEASEFLRSLDCFYYRTSDAWPESFGRVVAEAMACGLPVVCYRQGGYAEFVDSGNSGFLFDNNTEAKSILEALRTDAILRGQISARARQAIETLYSPAAIKSIAEYYLDPLPKPCAIRLV